MRVFDRLKNLSPTLSAGVVTADWMNLGAEIARLDGTGVEVLHIDVMDGLFAPGLSFGPPVIKAIRPAADLIKDVHLLIAHPLDKVEGYVKAGADVVTIHVESCEDPGAVLDLLGTMENANDPARGLVRGIAINPKTPLAAIVPLLDRVELVVILAVDAIQGDHPAPEEVATRVEAIKGLLEVAGGDDILVCLDGGVKRGTIDRVAGLGVDLVVSGSAIFDGKAPTENASFLLDRLRNPER